MGSVRVILGLIQTVKSIDFTGYFKVLRCDFGFVFDSYFVAGSVIFQ